MERFGGPYDDDDYTPRSQTKQIVEGFISLLPTHVVNE